MNYVNDCELCGRIAMNDPEEDDLDEFGYETPVQAESLEGSIRAIEHFVCYDCITELIWLELEAGNGRARP